MVNITDLQKKELSKYIPHLSELIESDKIGELLLAIDDIFLENLEPNEEPNEIGIYIQRLYDQIYYQNI